MIGSRAWCALMRRDLLYRRRNIVGTFFELVLPILFVWFLVLIKNAVENSDSFAPQEIPAMYPSNNDALRIFSFTDYVTTLQAERKCTESMSFSFPWGAMGGGGPPGGRALQSTVCQDNILQFSACTFGGICDCEDLVAMPDSTGCGGVLKSDWGDTPIDDICPLYCGVCSEGEEGAQPPWASFDMEPGFEISGIMAKGENWQVPFIKCDSRFCKETGEDALPFCEYLALGVAPSTAEDAVGLKQAQAFRDFIYERYPVLADTASLPFDFEFVQIMESNEKVEEYVKAEGYGTDSPKLALAVVFDGQTNPTINYHYSIRANATGFNSPELEARPATLTTPPTNKKFETYAQRDTESCPDQVGGTPDIGPLSQSCTGRYALNGVLTIQRLVHDFIIADSGAAAAGYSVSDGGVQFVPFPSKSYIVSGFYENINEFAPLLITLGLLYPVAAMVRFIVLEKELRQKELMKMMSVAESDIGWSWFVFFFLFHVVTAVGTAAVSTLLWEGSAALLLFFFWLFTLGAIVTFCMFLASIFTKATRATLVSLLVFFVGYFLTRVANYQNSSAGLIFVVSLHPVGAFAFGLQEIGRLEDAGVGLTVESMSETDSPNGYTFRNTLSNLLFDMVFWGIASWYSNRVSRGDYGQSLSWYFPFTLSYWCPRSVVAPTRDDSEIKYPDNVPAEPVSSSLREQGAQGKGIEIRNLRKVFGEKTAVDDLQMNLYSGQITALLGHNGAGKTTTISMLTGMLAPTSGYATIGGKDIRSDMNGIREGIGICLQHDCLFPELTVREHVAFFARIKGMYSKMSYSDAEAKVDASIEDVALFEKRNTLSKNLSGGMKRKLSVAIAFCGDSETVLLDEPTSGMDPFSRRFTWNVIRQYRQNRSIILTTHFMDEADILGDRIAIMAEGQLRCIGSSLFLKKTYGVGYQLTIEKKPVSAKKMITEDGTKEEWTSESSIDEMIQKSVSDNVESANLLTNVGTEISYQLPLGASANFAPIFDQLEEFVKKGDIVTYGVGITTLDEVFLLVARGATPEKARLRSSRMVTAETAMNIENDRSIRSRIELEKDGLFSRHVSALFKKRAMNFKRDRKAWCCTTILPSVFVLIGFMLFAFVTPERNLGGIEMTLDDYNEYIATESGPRNPIAFNNGNKFSCQTGKCIYDVPVVTSDATNELYYFCGVQNDIGNGTVCSTNSSDEVISEITEDGAEPVGASVSSVNESSYSLSETAYNYAATQYGGILFKHDSFSTVLEDTGSATAFDMYSGGSQADMSEGIDVESLGPMLESFGVDTSAFNITALLNMGFELDFLKDLLPSSGSVVGMNYAEAVVSKCLEQAGNYTTEADCEALAGIGYVVQYNYTAIHAAPLYQKLADEAIVREAIGDTEFKIKSVIHPLPVTNYEDSLGEADDAFTAWFLIILSFPFIAGSFATFVVQEKQSKAKHLQTVAGVKPTSYWLSTWLWDIANYQIPCWITVGLMFVFDVSNLTTTEDGVFSAVITLLLLFGPAVASYSYCISFMFTSPSTCNLILIISGFLIAFGGTLAAFILRLIGSNPVDKKENLLLAATIVEWVLRIFPPFNLSRGLYSAINLQTITFLAGKPVSAWEPDACMWEIIFLAWQSVGYLLLAMKIDEWAANPRAVTIFRKIFCCDWKSSSSDSDSERPEIDDDVAAEEQRVLTGGANDDLIVLSQLGKVYSNGKKAVDSLSLGIPPGQCFGLLGINGAGKTTTMGMLTAEFPPSSGDATLGGFSVTNEPEKTRRTVGYCPQFDAHFTNLTGREHVELYASIKGIPQDLVQEAAAAKLAQVGLSEFDSDRLAAGYSGGMKRRLSLATATIGNPQIVFLDECSTGVDPVARREIWEMVSNMVSEKNTPLAERTSVILTTHSMEECEALCPRIGIMAGGNLRCLGSAQQLKSKFGQGYQVEMKIKSVDTTDKDYLDILAKLAAIAGVTEEEAIENGEDIFLDFAKMVKALKELSSDGYLMGMVNEEDTHGAGYLVWKEAKSPTGIDLDELAEFAASELRMRVLVDFINEKYPDNVLRERQDTKARYEVSSKGVLIGDIFATVEANKDRLMVAEYGVSQTSLEQVFNMHAAEAEESKQGTNDSSAKITDTKVPYLM
eukprot:jgi/Psemu1/284283/fgenesh1_pg.48_\